MDAIIEGVVTLVVALAQLAFQGAVLFLELLGLVVGVLVGCYRRLRGGAASNPGGPGNQ